MNCVDIRVDLQKQLKQDYPNVPTCLCVIQSLYGTDIPTFLVTIPDLEQRTYSLTKIGQEVEWMSRTLIEYIEEELAG